MSDFKDIDLSKFSLDLTKTMQYVNPVTYTNLKGTLLDVRIGVDQQIGAGMARCALYRFHIAAGDHQLIGGTGMPQTVKHNAGELRVLVLPLDELLANEDRLYRQTIGQDVYKRQGPT